MVAIKNLEVLDVSIRAVVEAYSTGMVRTLGSNVRAVSIYGSATGPDYIPQKSNINMVAVLDTLDSAVLEALLGLVRSGMKKRIVPPLLLTPQYVKSSLDVFPMEFLEIRDTQVILYGDDYFSDLAISPDRLRLECESQLRASALRTRQAYLEIGLARRGAEKVLHASVTSLIPVFKAILRLRGAEVPRRKVEAAEALGKALGVGADVFVAVLRDKAGDQRIQGKDARRVLAEYIDAVEALTKRMEKAE